MTDTQPSRGRAATPARRPVARRAGLVLASAVLVCSTSTGCAMAMRAVTVAGTVSTISDLAGSVRESRSTAAGSGVRATVGDTGGSGLRLNRLPGSEPVAVLPDGTVVTVVCQAPGRHVDGPHGSTSTWSKVVTPDGSDGYMSDAYLAFTSDAAAVPPC